MLELGQEPKKSSSKNSGWFWLIEVEQAVRFALA